MLGIYCRISRDRETQKSIKEQTLLGIEFAAKHKLQYEVYIDKHVSGGKGIGKREALDRLLDDVDSGKITAIFIWNQDRIERDELTWFQLVNIILENNIKLYDDGVEVDLTDESEMMVRGFKTIMNANFRRTTKKKIKQVMKRNASEGKVHGVMPYGYTRDAYKNMIIHKEESVIVKRIFDLAENNVPFRKIADILNEEKIPTRYNLTGGSYNVVRKKLNIEYNKNKDETKWIYTTIYQIIKNPVYKGERTYGGITYNCPTIISEMQWNKVQNIKSKPGRRTKHKYLLNNLITCGKCGKRYAGRLTSTPDNSYRCVTKQYKNPTCNNRGIRQSILENFIWRRFVTDNRLIDITIKHFENTDTKKKIDELNKILGRIDGKIKGLQKMIRNVVHAIAIENIKPNHAKDTIEGYEKQIDELKIQKQEKEEEVQFYTNTNTLSNLKDELDILEYHTPFEQKQEFLERWIKDITIDYNRPWYRIMIELNIADLKADNYRMDTKYRKAMDTEGNIVWDWTEEEIPFF
jgi:DNA invertase Pin-like site-specific DNA recombinase